MNTHRFRLPLIALGVAVAFEIIYEVANFLSQGALTSYLADDAPKVVQWLHWSPHVLGVRVANSLGYRFDYVSFSAPWQFDAIVSTVAISLTAGVVWLVLWLSTYLVARSNRKVRAT